MDIGSDLVLRNTNIRMNVKFQKLVKRSQERMKDIIDYWP